ncbi:MAG TPA: hypothetical protein VG758_04490 [Hyphomicrobiaceae bacterium]|jgi:hypothetical protein|nr:hypothetical protein [Hyphomicrobiaceae bacterium]
MAARIVSLGRPHAAPEPMALGLPERAPGCSTSRRVWRGASGRSYPHTVYSLIECPPLPAATVVLARRDAQGETRALRVLLAQSDAPTLNLARVRQQGAEAGANEVHVHLDAVSDADRRLVACDLRAALFGSLAACTGSNPAEA